MKKFLLITGLVLCSAFLLPAQTYYKFVLSFKDKAPGTNPYSVEEPSAFLSERSLQRRSKLNIPITEQDLPVNPGYITGLYGASSGFTLINRSRWFNHVLVGTTDSSVAMTLGQLPYVKGVKLVYTGMMPRKGAAGTNTVAGTEGPGQPKTEKSVSGTLEDLAYGNSKTQVEMLGVDYLHRKGFMGQGMLVAVIDAGFQNVNNITAFDYIRTNNQLKGTWDFVMNDVNVYDDNSHGTGVLSCMAAYIDGEFIGTAPKAEYWLLRSEDAGTETVSEEYNWVAAAEFADSVGADLINSSLGYTTFDNPSDNHAYNDLDGNTTVITRAADIAAGKGILVVNSAGNSGNSGWYYIGAPADGDSVLTVGAVNDKRSRAGFSSFGPSFDGRVKPDVSAMGQNVFVVGAGGAITPGSGTSYAGPILCGAVASLWSKYPELDHMTIFEAVKKASHQYSVPDNSLGYGIPNFGVAELILKNTSFDNYFESQEINVYPNPVNDEVFYLDYYSNFTENIRIELSNSRGRVVYSLTKEVYEKALYTIPIVLDHKLGAGVYVLSVQSGTKRFTTKLVKS